MLRIGIVVGEPSGDALGAGLIKALKQHHPDLRFEGILGPRLISEGGYCHHPMDKLSVMGLTEIVTDYLDLVSIRNRTKHFFLKNPPDVFIGIDAPDFNLSLEQDLRQGGIKTIHYVSPSVWAWRRKRVHQVAKSADILLTLFPFESAYYQDVDLQVTCVGHPMANVIPVIPNTSQARKRLNLPEDKRIVAIMPGSRKREIASLSQAFLQTASEYAQEDSQVYFVANLINDESRDVFNRFVASNAPDLPISVYTGNSHNVIEASDAALVASGTVTLEAMLFKKPMVIGYVTSNLTYYMLRLMISSRWVGLPNILAQDYLVPEYFQSDVNPKELLPSLKKWLFDKEACAYLVDKFTNLHHKMRMNTDKEAAQVVMTHCQK